MEASHEQQLSLNSTEHTINVTKVNITQKVINPPQSPIPFSIIAYSSTREGGTRTRESARYNVYTCKTCNKTFTSFQALGGHRKVHKKPRKAHRKGHNNNTNTTSTTTTNNNNNNNKSNVYGCSICGSKFTSGQALGGHMNFHPAPVEATSLTPMALEPDKEDEEPPAEKTNVSLDLDLNLPPA
jgi:DNA-directed RNA polymerase subunit RPC12/RpoP